MPATPPSSLEAAVHLIQVALTPIFLLSGIAAMLNVFAARLARVADRLDHVSADLAQTAASPAMSGEIAALHRRSVLLDSAVVLGTVGATATCLSILTLFFVEVSAVDVAWVLLFFFGAAIVCTLLSVALFGLEMLISSHGLRVRMRLHVPDLRRFRFRRGA
jgi:hypothetical protein